MHCQVDVVSFAYGAEGDGSCRIGSVESALEDLLLTESSGSGLPRAHERSVAITLADGRRVSALLTPGQVGDRADWTFVYAPGAGSSLADPFGVALARALAARAIATLRFQFPYMEAGRRTPDRGPILEATWRAAIEMARADAEKLVIGGRSMGGRIASQVAAAQGVTVQALALFAYPLHPPGRPDQPRDRHLASLGAPCFFCSGTNDAFASPDELRALVANVPKARLHLLEGADHGFAVPKRSGRTREDVWAEAIAAFAEWIGPL